MFVMDTSRIPTLFGYTILGEYSRARSLTSEILHHVHAELPVLMLLGTSAFIAYRRSSKGFSIETQMLLLVTYLVRYARNLSLVAWGILFESTWLQLDTVAMVFRIIAAMITVFVTIRYSPHHRKISLVLQSTALYLVGTLSFAYAAKRTGLLMDGYGAPHPIYISSLFLEAVHLLPQYVLFSGSNDDATRVATIICSLSFVAVTVVSIAKQYFMYTMFRFMGNFWARAVWTHGASVAYLIVGTGCLVSALLSRPEQKKPEKN